MTWLDSAQAYALGLVCWSCGFVCVVLVRVSIYGRGQAGGRANGARVTAMELCGLGIKKHTIQICTVC